ncbi:MAG: FKBP-type peptidyl-prolyl cis-trans isomerase [Anaerolineae bacterium]
MLTIQDDVVVSMDYSLRLADGEIVDSSEGRGPLEFVQGHGNIIPGLEQALYGMETGEEKDVTVAPTEGYGEFDSDLFETLPREAFPADVELEPGMAFRMRTETGETVVATISELEEQRVTLNLNHPLAGKTLYFHVKIAGLREATEDELSGECAGCGQGGCGGCCEGGEEDQACGDDCQGHGHGHGCCH